MTVKLNNYVQIFKRFTLFIFLFCSFINTVNAQKSAGIGTDKPDPKAVLELNVENPVTNPQGLLLPRLTDVQGTLLGSMLNTSHKGMSAYNTTNNTFYIWDGTQWKSTGSVLTSIVGKGGITVSALGSNFTIDGSNLVTQWISASSNQIYTNSFVGIGTSTPTSPFSVSDLFSGNGRISAKYNITHTAPTGFNKAIQLNYSFAGTGATEQFAGIETNISGNQSSVSSNTPAFIANNNITGLGNSTGYRADIGGSNSGTKAGFDARITGTGGTVNLGYNAIISGASAKNIGINVNVSGGTTNYAALFNGGNVGIGSLAPTAKLMVTDGSRDVFIHAQTANNYEDLINIFNNNVGESAGIQILSQGNAAWNIYTNNDSEFLIGVVSNSLEGIKIKTSSNGADVTIGENIYNVGISTTTIASANFVVSALSGGAVGSVVTVNGAGKLGLGNLSPSQWVNTTNGIVYSSRIGINGLAPQTATGLNIKSVGNASSPIRVEYSGSFNTLFTVDEGTGGNGNIFLNNSAGTRVMQLSSSISNYFLSPNNFGIGTSVPGQKLEVIGNTSATGIGYFGTLVGNNMNGAPAGSVVTVDGTGRLGFGGQLTTSQWLTTAAGIYYGTSVGIGMLPYPNQPLALKSSSNGSTILGLVGATTTSNIIAFVEEAGNGVIRLSNNAGISRTQLTPFGNTYFLDNIGVGIQNPSNTPYRLLVKGNTSISGGTLAVESLTSGGVNLVSALADGTLTVTGQTITSSQWSNTTSGILYNSGNVAIGTSVNPTQGKLVVVEDAVNNPGIFVSGGGGTKSVNIQLGRTTSPDGGIGIAGAIGSFSGVAGLGDMVVRSESNNLILSSRGVGKDIIFTTGAPDTEKMRITNLGNVGIGVTPVSKLELKDSDVSNGAYESIKFDVSQSASSNITKQGLLLNYSVSGTASSIFRGMTTNVFGSSTSSNSVSGNTVTMNVAGSANISGFVASIPSNSAGTKTGAFIQVNGTGGPKNIGLDVNVSGATTNYAAILNGGNVGIGTSTPGQNLVVVGNESVTGIGYFGTLIGNNLIGPAGSVVTVDGVGKLGIGTLVQGNNYWQPNGASKIYTNSFVGIGNANPSYPLHINADENIGTGVVIRKNVVGTTTGNQIALSTEFTGSATNTASKIGLQAFILPSGTENVRGVSADIRGTGNVSTNYRGLDAYIENNGVGTSQGVYIAMDGIGNGVSSGAFFLNSQVGNGERYGVNAQINGLGNGNKYAIYARASGANSINYAGYFEEGLVYINSFTGIGTASPTAFLDVNGTLRFRTLNTAGSVLTVDGLGNVGMGTMPTASTQWLNNGTNEIYTLSTVGIGTTNPNNNIGLEINMSNTNNTAIELNSFGLGWGSGIRFGNSTGGTGRTYGIYSSSIGNFHFADAVANLDRMIIAPNGNIGIGALLTPTAKLDIQGDVKISSTLTLAGMAGGNYTLGINSNGQVVTLTSPVNSWLSTSAGTTYTNDKIAIGTSTVAGAAKFKVAGDGSMGGMVITSQSLVNPLSTSNTIYTTLITVPVYIPQGTNTVEFNVIGSSQGGGNIDFQLDVSGNTSSPISMINTTPTIGAVPQIVNVASLNGWQTLKINVANSAGNTSAILHGFTVIVKN